MLIPSLVDSIEKNFSIDKTDLIVEEEERDVYSMTLERTKDI